MDTQFANLKSVVRLLHRLFINMSQVGKPGLWLAMTAAITINAYFKQAKPFFIYVSFKSIIYIYKYISIISYIYIYIS